MNRNLVFSDYVFSDYVFSDHVFSDYVVFVIYFIIVASYGIWIYRRKKKAITNTKDFFLAEGSLTWWAIGASLIASNISAEQFIGMSGDGFFAGIAVAAYEWIAAIALIIIAIWFIPVYLRNKIYTMPQFLKTRYKETVALIMAISGCNSGEKSYFHGRQNGPAGPLAVQH